jgi:hypothetical protein
VPTSDINTVPAIIHEVCRLQPKSILDLGSGCGKYDVLCREYLDKAYGRFAHSSWQVKIDAVEGFETYIDDLHYAVCDSIKCEDFSKRESLLNYRGYDLVMMIDSLEHLTHEIGEQVLKTLLRNNKQVIVSVPWGQNFLEQGAVHGNEFERHLGKWAPSEFQAMGGRPLYIGVCAAYSIPGLG